MQIVEFTAAHIEQAAQIARQNYETERGRVPALPAAEHLPDLMPFAANGLGVAAFEDDTMLGFLCCVQPFANAFGSTGVTGVFSPMGTNGTVCDDRAKVYVRMYEAAATKWARAGAASHAVCLYAHDKEAQEQFFRYGFGLCCVDAIRPMEELHTPDCAETMFSELNHEDFLTLLPMQNALIAHLGQSPMFMAYPPMIEKGFLLRPQDARYFAAQKDGMPVAYMKVADDGENFACDASDMQNICGAYCLPEHRGRGISSALLNYIICTLKAEGYTRLGVDFESFNPAARGFWLKHFTPYTHGVVRRIDEGAVSR